MAENPPAAGAYLVQAAWSGFQKRLSDFTQQAAAHLAQGNAHAAHQVNRDALACVESFYAEWETSILAGARLTGQEALFSESIRNDRLGVLWAASSTATLVGDRDAAGGWLATARALLPDEPSLMRAMILNSAADLAVQRPDHAEAMRLFASAADDYAAVQSWEARVQALAAFANCALLAGNTQEFSRASQQAITEARVHGHPERAARLELQWLSFRMKADAEGAVPERFRTERRRLRKLSPEPNYQIDVAVALGEFAESIGDRETAREEYLRALEHARELPARQWSVLQALVRFEQEGNLAQALAYAERGLLSSRQAGVAGQTLQSLQSLIGLRLAAGEMELADAHLAEIRRTGDPDTLFNTLFTRALVYAKSKQWDAALIDLAEARTLSITPEQARNVRLARVGVLTKAGHLAEALLATDEAAQAGVDSNEAATLEENAAEIEARLGHPDQALLRTERSRTPASSPDVREIQSWVEAEQVAAVWLSVTGRGTLVVVAEPGHPPTAQLVPLTENDLAALLPPLLSDSEWNRKLVAALSTISGHLSPALEAVTQRVRVLYLCPDSRLFRLPFAALAFADGTHLIDRCALTLAPSASEARKCLGRSGGARTLYAGGAGAAESFSFGAQAEEIARLPGWAAVVCQNEITADEFLRQAPDHKVIHLACHGIVEASVLEGMEASRLILSNHAPVTAKMIISLPLRADLIFLNACTSGVYQSQQAGEAGGFWRAFLGAGAASLIATLSYVDPGAAQEVAAGFYRGWNTAALSKAEALRLSQLALKAAGRDPLDWSSHVLIGSHR